MITQFIHQPKLHLMLCLVFLRKVFSGILRFVKLALLDHGIDAGILRDGLLHLFLDGAVFPSLGIPTPDR